MPAWLEQLRRGASDRPLLGTAELHRLARLAEQPGPPERGGAQPGGERLSPLRGHGLDFQELRRYQAGDDVRAMDWRTTARTGRPHVRVYHQEPRPSLYLLVDLGARMRFGTRVRLKAAQAARVAVYQALRTVRDGGAVGAALLGEPPRFWPVRGGRVHAMALTRALAAPCPPPDGFMTTEPDRALGMLRRLPVGTEVLILSDLHWLDSARAGLLGGLVAAGRPVQAVCITDAAERTLPPLGRAPFSVPGAEGALWVDTTRPGVRAAFDAHAMARVASLRRLLTGAGVRFTELGAETPAAVWTRSLGKGLPGRG
ncbi:hypothetical protein B1C78_11485 [Thioalkalivibrio denitrificans]|uniref:DUF58 domain-containing protein n=1 Tax=Thioalkalivibrio denitrificans TaxID=108003 RepID=A0A1V3NEK7_9GAMM|nr:DUF58 domain-containing protein [Thioalkalivibrio denitrificans]OOG23363.1 hypothetical protein B1C78_11485 [Thioalkalivibrio denitrificans]